MRGGLVYQVHFERGTDEEFRAFIVSVARRASETPDAKVLFHLFNDTAVRDVTDRAAAVVREVMPDALVVGCSTSGNICNGLNVSGGLPNLTAVADVLESPSTRVEVHQFTLDADHRAETAGALLKLVEERPWVKAVELVTTVMDDGMYAFCDDISAVRGDIVFFGGAAMSTGSVDVFSGLPYVFSSDGASDGHAIVFVLYGGDEFHVRTRAVSGWKPLGMPLAITRAQGPVVHEIDGKPAFERYHHYLAIENNDSFSENSLLFPFAFENGDATVIKAPALVDDDGSITLTSDIAPDQRTCRIAYGDPSTILRSIKECADDLREFAPQAVLAYSCTARFMYWGPDYVRCETLPFNGIAPTAGFYSGGEFARHGSRLMHHNVTLVVAAMREGEAREDARKSAVSAETQLNRQMAIVNSLTAFIGAVSDEVQDAYDRMQLMAKVDGLTGIFNRREIESRIVEALEAATAPDAPQPCIVMLDLDDFKKINDVYGHRAGDDVLRQFGALLSTLVDDAGAGSSGRWGGEEFMVLLPDATLDAARGLVLRVLQAFSETRFASSGRHTASAGIAQAIPGETDDLLCLRADKALYSAKKQGKNRVVVA